jgi:plastocyanin
MRLGLEVRGRRRAFQIMQVRKAGLALLTAVLLTAAAGCDSKRAERESAGSKPEGKSGAATDAGVQRGARTGAARKEASPSGTPNRVRLTQKRCVQFEPHWTSIGAGQSLTWTSELKTPITIHVSPGAFEQTEFVVRAGASVNSGPARRPGWYSIWTTPAACQGIPRGVQGSGPGVMVEGEASRQ